MINNLIDNKRKSIKICCILGFAVCVVSVFFFFYTSPSKWISYTGEDILFVRINEYTENKEVTVTDVDEIENIITIIRHTRTKWRQYSPNEQDVDNTDSGFLITIGYKNLSTETVHYSFIKNGLVYLNPDTQNISFHNKKLYDVLLMHLNHAE